MATATTSRPPVYGGETLHNIDWATYCKLRDDPANHHLRMMYLDGKLTIKSPHLVHDYESRGIMIIIMVVARACQVRCMVVGTTTLRKEGRGTLQGTGKEPDEGVYLGDDVARIRGKKTLDLNIDPPPTLALEVDNTVYSEPALESYARIGVPEGWRFDVSDQTLSFGLLDGDHYQDVDRSRGLPRLTPQLILEALDARTRELDDTDWLDNWARNLPKRIDRRLPIQNPTPGRPLKP